MIEFEWRQNYTHEYRITWDNNNEPYDVLFLHYRNVSPILRIGTDKVISFDDQPVSGIIPIYPSDGYHYEAIPNKKLPYAEYVFELKKSEDIDSDCIPECRHELCNAPRIEVFKKEVPYQGTFSRLLIKSSYKISSMLMDLFLPIMPNESFSIPEMKISSDNMYETGCLIKTGFSDKIEVRFNDKIAKFIVLTEV